MENCSKLRCQRIGCDAFFTEDDNPDGSCVYHASGPIFHDGMKEWSCCKQRSHDFNLFLEIRGCKTGKHTTEKPVVTPVSSQRKLAPSPSPSPSPSVANNQAGAVKAKCLRCRQGFFCSDHGSQSKPTKPALDSDACVGKSAPAPVKKIIDLNEPQTCKNKGCGKTFKEKGNHANACQYHPGPAVFHDRMRGWKCCDIHVKEFDEFMNIPPCTKGWHNADPAS